MDRRTKIGTAAVALVIATFASWGVAAADSGLRRVATLSSAPADWVRTDGRWVAFGRGSRLTVAEAGPPFTVRFERSLGGPVSDVLLAGRRLIVVVGGRQLGLIDVASHEADMHAVELRPAPLGDLRLGLDAGHLLVTESGLGTRVLRMEPFHGAGHHHAMAGHVPGLVQIDLRRGETGRPPDQTTAGRLVYVAGGDEGLLLYRDETAGAQFFPVAVLNDFYSPQQLAILVGDTVSWTNASGFHNVRSCVPAINGCDVTSNETFSSGPPADPLWNYVYTFLLAGSNPYICQSHAPFMTGLVDVFLPTPPVVPAAMTVDKLDASGSLLSLIWDATGCPGADGHQILYGSPDTWPAVPGGTYGLDGSECGIGTSSPHAWSAPAGVDLLWWVIVATNGEIREGSWGRDSQLQERSGPGPGGSSGECGMVGKILANTCGE